MYVTGVNVVTTVTTVQQFFLILMAGKPQFYFRVDKDIYEIVF